MLKINSNVAHTQLINHMQYLLSYVASLAWLYTVYFCSSAISGQGLSVEVIGIIVGCILAVVVIIIAIIAVIACVYCW